MGLPDGSKFVLCDFSAIVLSRLDGAVASKVLKFTSAYRHASPIRKRGRNVRHCRKADLTRPAARA